MYITMNRFKVMKGAESAFEHVWLSRDTHLDRVPESLEFHLLRGPERDDHVLYSSHTVWASKDAFTAWTQSEHFRAAHRDAGANKPLYLGHPEFEGRRRTCSPCDILRVFFLNYSGVTVPHKPPI